MSNGISLRNYHTSALQTNYVGDTLFSFMFATYKKLSVTASMARPGRSQQLHVDDLRWIKDPLQLKDELLNVVEAYKSAQTETLKYYMPSAAEGRTHVEVACLSDSEMELHPAGLTFPMAFVFTSKAMAVACKKKQRLLCKEGSDGELLACDVPPYQTNVSLAALREIHNSCSGGGYQGPTDMDYFVAIFPNEEFDRQSCKIEKRSGGKGLCKIFSKELYGQPLPYEAILAIGKGLLQ